MDSFKGFITVRDRLDSFFEDSFSKERAGGELLHGTWSPAVDIYETEVCFVLRAELSGIKRKDIIIEVKDNTLVLKGKREFSHDIKEESYRRMERSYGTFIRCFNLASNVLHEKVVAKFKDGILDITLPKQEPYPSDIIKVNVE